jgi:hypothetical protein
VVVVALPAQVGDQEAYHCCVVVAGERGGHDQRRPYNAGIQLACPKDGLGNALPLGNRDQRLDFPRRVHTLVLQRGDLVRQPTDVHHGGVARLRSMPSAA